MLTPYYLKYITNECVYVPIMTFEKKYDDKDVIKAIKVYSDTATVALIAKEMDCAKQTVTNLLKEMMVNGLVKRINRGSHKKPQWLYRRTAKGIQTTEVME